MIQVFIEVTGQNGQRTIIPGGPFPNSQAAHQALFNYGVSTYGSYPNLIQAIDAYGFIVNAVWVIRTPTKP
jgi:hypothetical protein